MAPKLQLHVLLEQLQVVYQSECEMQQFSAESADVKALIKNSFGPVPTKFRRGFDAFSRYFFWTIAKFQSQVDAITWYGAVWKGRNVENLSEAEAILFADTMVEGAQTSGIFSDRSGFERGTLGPKIRQSQAVRLCRRQVRATTRAD